MATFEDFLKLDMRVGQIVRAKPLQKAKNPAFSLWIDFGQEIGIKKSSAQITECYGADQLIGRQVVAVINFPPKKVAGFASEVLVLGVYAKQGVVLLGLQQRVTNGDKIG